jgi:hypothetical protein
MALIWVVNWWLMKYDLTEVFQHYSGVLWSTLTLPTSQLSQGPIYLKRQDLIELLETLDCNGIIGTVITADACQVM